MSFLAHHITPKDYERAKTAYNTWATMTMLDSRPMPDSTLRSWDRLKPDEQRYIWDLFRVPDWDNLNQWQKDAWALAMQQVSRDT